MPIRYQSDSSPAAPATPTTYPEILAQLLNDKWEMVSEGPSGAQLKRPKKMMTQTQVCFIAGGVLLFFFWPLALVLLLVATLDYSFFTKTRTYFLSREVPVMPPSK